MRGLNSVGWGYRHAWSTLSISPPSSLWWLLGKYALPCLRHVPASSCCRRKNEELIASKVRSQLWSRPGSVRLFYLLANVEIDMFMHKPMRTSSKRHRSDQNDVNLVYIYSHDICTH